jgi:energy-coupling factor transport system substrate-specific component
MPEESRQESPPEPVDDILDYGHSPASSRMATLALIPSAVAFNIALAQIVLFLKLPVYLDCVGIITTTLIAGLIPGLIVTVLAFAMTALLFNHIIIFYTGTAAMMAVITHLSAMIGGFKTMFRTVLSGLVLGIVSALVSLPVTVLVFGGVTTAGATFLTAWFVHRGFSTPVAVFMTNMICDASTDKIAEVLIAVWLVRAVPADLLAKFNGPTLAKNFKLHTPAAPGFDIVTPDETRKPT